MCTTLVFECHTPEVCFEIESRGLFTQDNTARLHFQMQGCQLTDQQEHLQTCFARLLCHLTAEKKLFWGQHFHLAALKSMAFNPHFCFASVAFLYTLYFTV